MSIPDSSITTRSLMERLGITKALEDGITEFAINRPGEYWIEAGGMWRSFENPALSIQELRGLTTAMAVFNKTKVDRDSPIASLTLPDGERCQVVMPPVCTDETVSITIRKPSQSRFTLADYEKSGRLLPSIATIGDGIANWEENLVSLMEAGRFREFFELAVQHKLNIVTVGGTGSGKTTFSKSLIDLYPATRRIFTIEDTHELTTPFHRNAVHLFFSAKNSAKSVLASTMRMKPDHIFLTELRGDEAWDYLMALRSGHAGSVTSTHANDCAGALFKIGSYIKQSDVGRGLDMSYIMSEVKTTIDVVVYFEDTKLKQIYYDPAEKLRLLRGAA